jgi:hypothetical protein
MTILAVINTKDMAVRVFDERVLVDKAQLSVYDDTVAEDYVHALKWLLEYNEPGQRLARQMEEILKKQKLGIKSPSYAPAKLGQINVKYSLPDPS